MENTYTNHWHITPVGLPAVIRRCPKCGVKKTFINTERIRVNANKRCLDVWMIFQCHHCKATWNKTIFERISPTALSKAHLEALTVSDPALVKAYSFDMGLYGKQDELDLSPVHYDMVEKSRGHIDKGHMAIKFTAEYALTLTLARAIRQCYGLSASQLKKLEATGAIWGETGIALRKKQIGREALVYANTWPVTDL